MQLEGVIAFSFYLACGDGEMGEGRERNGEGCGGNRVQTHHRRWNLRPANNNKN